MSGQPGDTQASAERPSCEDIEHLLPLVADGAISHDGDPAVFEHLARCSTCQDSLARHDLVALSLTCGANQRALVMPTRGMHYRLPWPAAAAAVLALGAFGTWLAPELRTPPATVATTSATVNVIAPTPQRPYYMVVRNGVVTIIDPDAVDGGVSHERSELHSVKLDRSDY